MARTPARKTSKAKATAQRGRAQLPALVTKKLSGYNSIRCLTEVMLIVALSTFGLLFNATNANAGNHTLQAIYDACFDPKKPWQWSAQRRLRLDLNHPGPASIRFRNKSRRGDYLEFCVYDIVCKQIVFKGRLGPRAEQRFRVCRDKSWRGSILVLEKAGHASRFDNLGRKGTVIINLPLGK